MNRVLRYKHKYRQHWRDRSEEWWFIRLQQEVGELADTFTGELEEAIRTHELRQIASICFNWLDKRGEYEDE